MALRGFARVLASGFIASALSACTLLPPEPRPTSAGHLGTAAPEPVSAVEDAAIPAPVSRSAYLPPPSAGAPEETYTVVVNDVPVRELLFALARDASINVDVHPAVQGSVTLNAIDQSLFQILDRIARQMDIRYSREGDTIAIVPDSPFLRTYKVDYVNVTRDSGGTLTASTLVSSGATGGQSSSGENTSVQTIKNTSNNQFWETLASTLDEIVQPEIASITGQQKRVILNRESGLILVRATNAQHLLVQRYLDSVISSATRQVLIEATIVEVTLNDRYQAGINWQVFTRQGGLLGAGITLGSDLAGAFTAGASGAVTGLVFNASDAPTGSAKREVQVSLNLLNEFGDTQVLSSPKVMTLNNQPAVLKVVDEEVYFDVEIENTLTDNRSLVTATTDVRTVAVGLVMSVVPQVAADDMVTLNVRPTITRVRNFVDDPAVAIALAQARAVNPNLDVRNVQNQVPVIQVRESESVMRVGSGQLAILGGLMQDRKEKDDEAVPGFSEIPAAGELFKFRDRQQTKTELVVFLRPTVIRSPDVRADLAQFSAFLPENLEDFERQRAPFTAVEGASQ